MDDGSAGFFKVLLDDFWEKLKIPTKFVRTVIKEQEWQSVKLESSLGKIWSVKVKNDSNGFHYFGEGWREFVEAHGLRFGYFLVFTYGGNMGFLVTVFDQTECRKWYGPIAKNENVIIDDEVVVKDCKVSEKPKEEPVTYSQRQMADSVGRCPKAKGKSHFAVFKTAQFKVTINPCNLLSKEYLRIPNSFLVSNDLSGIRQATLANSNGHWSVKLYHHRNGNQMRSQFGHGWRSFWSKNNLEAGDVCVFDLLSKNKNKVHFFVSKERELSCKDRENNFQIIGDNRIEDIIDVEDYETLSDVRSRKKVNEDYSTAYDNSNSKRKISQADWSLISQKRSEISKRPEFIVRLKHNHLINASSYLCIPSKFEGSKFLSGKRRAILEDVKGKSWHVNLYENRKHKNGFQIGAGWHSCATDNRLQVGDVCSFKLMSKKDIVMRFEVLSKEINKYWFC